VVCQVPKPRPARGPNAPLRRLKGIASRVNETLML
jgi:hypothetical protein